MPSFWPQMYDIYSWWRGERPQRFAELQYGFFVGRGDGARSTAVRLQDSTTCREILGSHVRRYSTRWKEFMKPEYLAATDTNFEATIRIHKAPPSEEWLYVWKNTYGWAHVFEKADYNSSNGYLELVLRKAWISKNITPESEISFPLFFYNRSEEFPIEVLGSHDNTIAKIFSYGDRFWGGNSSPSVLSFCHAFAVYALKRNVRLEYDLGPTSSGVGRYIQENILWRYAPLLKDFLEENKLTLKRFGLDNTGATPSHNMAYTPSAKDALAMWTKYSAPSETTASEATW